MEEQNKLNQEVVVTQLNKKNLIKFISNYELAIPFDNIVINFFDEITKTIHKDNKIISYKDIKSFGFWARKKNIISMINNFKNIGHKSAIGLIFHIPPTNTPINIIYSLFFGLITGNANIVKVPSKYYFQTEYLINLIERILKKKKFIKLRKMIFFARYSSLDNTFTSIISNSVDRRFIWGGDETIRNVKKFLTKPNCIDYTFPDRYSLSIINYEKYKKLNTSDVSKLAKKFINDTYVFDQNACSSPHLIAWYSDKKIIDNKKNDFWKSLDNELKKEGIDYPNSVIIEKYNILISDLISFSNIRKYNFFSKNLSVIDLKSIHKNNNDQRGIWGLFYQINIRNLNEILKISNKKYQSLTYFGFDKHFFLNFLKKKPINGIDRIIPIGRALEMSNNWDGFDFFKILTRNIDIK